MGSKRSFCPDVSRADPSFSSCSCALLCGLWYLAPLHIYSSLFIQTEVRRSSNSYRFGISSLFLGYAFRSDGRYFVLAERYKSRETLGLYDAFDTYRLVRVSRSFWYVCPFNRWLYIALSASYILSIFAISFAEWKSCGGLGRTVRGQQQALHLVVY